MVTDMNVNTLIPDTMTLEELAHRMGISLTVAYELAKKDSLPVPAMKVGRQWRFSRRAWDALMSGQHTDLAAGSRTSEGT